jgi:CRISPR/Cas system CSM-associated protein Csm3 (group 7 of RAMP superfamily)
MTKNNANIKGRFLIKGTLSLLSPLIIGTGEKQDLDIVVIKDINGNPYIPATSLTGALRHYFYEQLLLKGDRNQFDFFWGSPKDFSFSKDSCFQSAFVIDDLIAINTPSVTFRDGVCIDPCTGTARDEMKYDYEVVEPEADFVFNAQVTLREGFCRHTFLKTIASIIKILAENKVSLGAMTTKGFGKCHLKNYTVYEYDFTKKKRCIRFKILLSTYSKNKYNVEPALIALSPGFFIFQMET